MKTYKNIIDDFRKIADKHKQINSFGTGDIRQLIYLTQEINGKSNDKNNAPIYPLMYVIPSTATRGEQQITLTFQVIITDIMNAKNYDIETDLYSDTLQMAEDVLAQFKYSVTESQGDYEGSYDIVLPVSVSPFSEAYDDILVGWNLTLQIVLDNPLNRCIAPFNNFN